ncbi:hypothetical protein HA402_003187 [Bradysia odoriphaga]|nr:hypothetical protein HA402_003187 [Bradysia odoriphaga]
MYNKNQNGYPNRSSGSRMWHGMSSSLPCGMSQYAYQDTDFSSAYPSRRMFEMPPSSSTLGAVGHMSSSSTSSLTGCNNSGTNLIVNYLPQDMTDREFYALFSTSGPIESSRIMRDFKTCYSFGYGFVNYLTEEGAQRAIKSLNGVTVRNKRLKVSYARPAGEELKETNLYVTNLPRTITEEQLDEIFGKYGLIVQKNILRDKMTGKPRGVAFIRYNKREEAQEAIAALNNVIPEGSNQPLTVRVAEEHGKQKATQFYNSTMNMNMNMMNSMHYPPPSSVMHRGRARFRFQNITPY